MRLAIEHFLQGQGFLFPAPMLGQLVSGLLSKAARNNEK
jgi:hypothetical protein